MELKVEKIKTIGDCYRAVAGLPQLLENHAELVIEFGKRMLYEIQDFNKSHNSNLSMRIGINTGEVVAGVIGEHKFIYDLWGDAVNTASRMESSGIPEKNQVSEFTFQKVKVLNRIDLKKNKISSTEQVTLIWHINITWNTKR